jgi:hypothetical protein
MAKQRGKRSVLVLAILWLGASASWAEPPARRSDPRKRVELKIAQLEDRLAESVAIGQDGSRESQLVVAGAQVELARKLLSRRNIRAAEQVLTQAERALDRAEGKGEEP